MKILFIIICLVFLLSSCFGITNNDKKTTKKTGLELYSTGDFSVAIPSAWKKYTNDKILPKPIFGKVVLASVSKDSKLGFYNNFVILSQKLSQKINSYQYSIFNNISSKNNYVDYKLIKQDNFIFGDGDKSKIYVFEAKYNINSPKTIFIQTGKVCNNIGYILTIGLNQTQKDIAKYENIFKTFLCRNINKKLK